MQPKPLRVNTILLLFSPLLIVAAVLLKGYCEPYFGPVDELVFRCPASSLHITWLVLGSLAFLVAYRSRKKIQLGFSKWWAVLEIVALLQILIILFDTLFYFYQEVSYFGRSLFIEQNLVLLPLLLILIIGLFLYIRLWIKGRSSQISK